MKKIIILITLLLVFITGCDSYIELNDLAIINAIGIEVVDDKYKVYISLVFQEKDTIEPKIEIKEEEGKKLPEVIDNLSLNLSKKVYLSNLDLLLINDSIKSKSYEEIINFFLNNNETREDFLIATTDNIKKTLETAKFLEINDLIENNQKSASKTIKTTMYDLINNFYQKEAIYLPYIKLDNNISLDGIKKFQNNNYQKINEDDVIYLNYLLNNIDTYKYSYHCLNNNNKYLYLNILKANVTNLKNELIITNEIKVITNDCNLKKTEIDKLFQDNLKSNLKKFTSKKITIKNTIRGVR